MNSEMYNHFLEIVKRKANRMKEEVEKDSKFKFHCQDLLNDKDLLNKTEIDKLKRAFLLGAVDAMISDMASASGFRVFGTNINRKKLIKEIFTDS
jgi:hypothetical protein